MAKNSNLHKAKKAKNDEFYTLYSDIEKEMVHYIDFFRDKVVYCNCDSLESNFFKYFFLNFRFLGLRRLICTSYNEGGHGTFILTDQGDINNNGLIDENEVIVTDLEGDGDFRSQECIDILQTADVVVTNPPFSLYREYMAQLVKYGKKFLIMGNGNAITYKEVFPLIKDNQMWLGATLFTGKMPFFVVPKEFISENDRVIVKEDGTILKQVNSIAWFTNIDHRKRHQPLDLYKKYNTEEFPKYDNYLAFNVDKTADIPMDDFIDIEISDEEFEKWNSVYGDDLEIISNGNIMRIRIKNPIYGVPITFLAKYCPEQFEIVSFRKGEDGKDLFFFTRERERVQPYFRILVRQRFLG